MAGRAKDVVRKLERAGESEQVGWLGRIGLVAKGISFGLVGVLAILVALGVGGQPADREGALRVLSREPYGLVALLALAVGFASYAAWRFAQAFLDRDDEGTDAKGAAKRLGCVGKGVLYSSFALLAVSLVTGPRGESESEPERTARVFELPFGRWLVGAVGVGIVGYGLWNGYRSASGSYRNHMKTWEMNTPARWWLNVVGAAGHGARMLLFCLIGAFLVKAAYQVDPKEAVGLDGALARLAQQPYGPWLLGLAALGLLAYGAYSLAQARYRDV